MRINFFAGAGAGKTTTAHWLFSELKRLDYSVEFAHEYIKQFTYKGVQPKNIPQRQVYDQQYEIESVPLFGGVKNSVSECPVRLSYIYSIVGENYELAEELETECADFDYTFPSVSIYLDRGDKPFKTEGRWGTLEDARKVDEIIKAYLVRLHHQDLDKLLFSSWEKRDEILAFAEKHLEK